MKQSGLQNPNMQLVGQYELQNSDQALGTNNSIMLVRR